jgi:hypothetical protein
MDIQRVKEIQNKIPGTPRSLSITVLKNNFRSFIKNDGIFPLIALLFSDSMNSDLLDINRHFPPINGKNLMFLWMNYPF